MTICLLFWFPRVAVVHRFSCTLQMPLLNQTEYLSFRCVWVSPTLLINSKSPQGFILPNFSLKNPVDFIVIKFIVTHLNGHSNKTWFYKEECSTIYQYPIL